jgi:hypothetical protein
MDRSEEKYVLSDEESQSARPSDEWTTAADAPLLSQELNQDVDEKDSNVEGSTGDRKDDGSPTAADQRPALSHFFVRDQVSATRLLLT